MTPFYDHAGITIYHGDCREILPSLGPFDLLLTDPPYGNALDTANARRRRGGRIQYDGSISRSIDHQPVAGNDQPFDPAPLLKLAPAAILWGANHYASRLPDSACWLVWDRKAGKGAGSVTDCELAVVLGHRFKTVRMFSHLWVGHLRASENACRNRQLHPTQKPVALMSWCLSFFPEARTIIDPYMGSGPVAKACADAGLRYVGIELVEAYCERAVARLAQEALFA